MDVVHYDKPPLTVDEVTAIEDGHKRVEDRYNFVDWTSEGRQAHVHRGDLISQLNYTAAVIVDLQLRLANKRDTP